MKILFLLFINNKNQQNQNALNIKFVAAQGIAPLQFVNCPLLLIPCNQWNALRMSEWTRRNLENRWSLETLVFHALNQF